MDKCNKELEDIEKEITCASMKGNYSFSKDGFISKETRKYLEDLGYKITTGQQYNESYYTVSW